MKAQTGKKNNTDNPAKRLGIGYFIASAIFLFNPYINIVDLLPDFFGYLFLIKALTKWADLCPNIADAMESLGKLRWFMLLKMAAMLLVPLVDDTYVLVLTFAFLAIEYIYLIPSLGRIFDGFVYFGTRFNGHAIFANIKNVRTLTYLLFIGKGLLGLFPELCSLSNFEHLGYVTSGIQIDYADYKYVLAGLNLILSSLIGILWLVNIIPYFRRIASETEFLSRIINDYDLEITKNFGLTFRRALRSAVSLIIAGFLFFPNLWIDGVNIIPTFIGAIFLTVAMYKLRSLSLGSKWSYRASIIFIVISAISYAVSLYFSINFGLESITRDFAAYEFYNITRILSLFEYAAMAFSIYMVYSGLRRLIRMHLGPDPDVTDRRLTDIYATHQHEADNGIVGGFIGFIIVLIINAAYIIMRADIDIAYWIIPFLAFGIWIIYMISTLNQLYDQIEYKYI